MSLVSAVVLEEVQCISHYNHGGVRYVGGRYSPDSTVLAQRHGQLHRAAKQMWGDCDFSQPSNG